MTALTVALRSLLLILAASCATSSRLIVKRGSAGSNPVQKGPAVLSVLAAVPSGFYQAGSRAVSPPGVTILAQVGNPRWWPDLMSCMVNVKSAMEAERHGFQVFLSFQNDTRGDRIDEIEKDAQSTFGSAIVRSIRVENKGADIGPYLRQLQVLGEEPLDKHHDMFLKIHTKSKRRARRNLLGDLCGNRERIRNLYTRLRQSKSVGMVGPTERVWAAPWAWEQNPHGTRVNRKVGVLWPQGEVDAMNRTWQIMHPTMSFEKGVWDMARIIQGSFYWARQEAVLYKFLLQSVDKLVESMPHGYRTDSCCQTAHALERLMPTMAVTILGLDVVSVKSLLAA